MQGAAWLDGIHAEGDVVAYWHCSELLGGGGCAGGEVGFGESDRLITRELVGWLCYGKGEEGCGE